MTFERCDSCWKPAFSLQAVEGDTIGGAPMTINLCDNCLYNQGIIDRTEWLARMDARTEAIMASLNK